jgi:preprotein translocase subunit SecF
MIKYRKLFYIISGILVLASLTSFAVWRLNPAIDFTGGSLLEVEYKGARPEIETIRGKADALKLGNILIQPIGEKGLLLRLRDITETEHQSLLQVLGQVEQKRFDSIGPVIGKELTRKAWTSIILVIIMIVLFIAWVFRKVSRPVSSWKYGLVAIVALVHDVAIPVGVFSVLGHFYHIEVDILFVTALLTILGFSVHDTIVVFDRVRENLKKNIGASFEGVISQSLKQVRGRSIKTSLAILLVLVSLFVFGGATIKYFTFTLILGIVLGTYSSLFLASPLLVTWHKFQEARKR